ncbi:uncharacterized protein C17orf80 homolog [Hemicordylus capensis]|uniref:uncharacterized protein C17orf80 homolog n=1 Tax=Hemicordylus capensis TaxID=884348 RepID=UPI002302F31D|nr:uncharacterized protein C17orf80 homolog [Hemicordylus capensis]XP_053144074.1 uncharacterized protein C17orf80 homolog [Hemicordylus capensis]XP_053144075.1 uncharacterized protein C17orf80 homolog [Hemicordylus capensis]XP_053144076.1 uncharacterized protein C17orf80 homolog [Hemicordylus capensis]
MAGVEICPYCKKTFKRLKSHLPHCKLAALAFDSSRALSPDMKAVAPTFLNNEAGQGQTKSADMTSKKEKKKSKPDLVKEKAKVKAHSLELLVTTGSSTTSSHPKPGEDTEKQIKHAAEKTCRTEGNRQRALEEEKTHLQPAEKLFSATKLAKEAAGTQKSRSKTTSNEKKFASGSTSEPRIQSGKSTSKSPSQTVKPPAKQRQTKEAPADQSMPSWLDSSMGDLQGVPQDTADRVELVIENHRARVLRNRCKSSVENNPLNDGTINKPGHCPVESSSGGAEIALANAQEIITETVDRGEMLGHDLAGDVWSAETGSTVTTTTNVCTSDDHVMNNCRKVSSVPVQLTAGVKGRIGVNQLMLKGEAYPQESSVYCTPKSNPYPSCSEVLRGRYETSNKYLISLEKEIALDYGTIVAAGSKKSGASLQQLSLHALEMTAAHWFSSPESGVRPSSLGLEWFPELYPNYHALGLFSRKEPLWDTRISEAQVLILPCEGQQVPLAKKCLMDVKLQDLPAWLTTRDLSPQGMLRVPYRAWNGYYNKYINVKKGGVAGISILLLGYCVLSYAWSYEHIKHSRWRKYH